MLLLEASDGMTAQQYRLGTTEQVQDYNLYEYDAVHGRIIFGSERLIESYTKVIPGGRVRNSVEFRPCQKLFGC